MDSSQKHTIGQKKLNKNEYILYIIPFIKSIKTNPVRGQDSSRGFEGIGGWRWVLLGAGFMAKFNLYKFIKLRTYNFIAFLYHFNILLKTFLSLKYIIMSLVSMPDVQCVNFSEQTRENS